MQDIQHSLEYYIGASWPRSGHHLLVRILESYFGKRFNHCEFYTPESCCKTVPCSRAGLVNFSKNHDYKFAVPVLASQKYLIQYRKFCPALVSNYELFVRNNNIDTQDDFRKLAESQAKKYSLFMNRWAGAEAANTTLVGISYEMLTGAPADTLETVIGLFSPCEPVDREKLRHSLESVEQITVKGGAERTEAEKGVFARRDIRSFRHYDEAFFQSLDERTMAAYEALAILPVVRDFSGAKTGVSSAWLPRAVGETGARDLYIDVSGALALSSSAPTGIPRVQDFVVRQAIEDKDPNVRVILYDRNKGFYRDLIDRERVQLTTSVPTEKDDRSSPKWKLLWRAFREVRKNASLGKDFDRYWAARISNRRRGQIGYFLVKTTIRGYRLYRRVFSPKGLGRLSKFSEIDPSDGIVLMSHSAVFGSLFAECFSKTKRRAFICHDVIPWLHPEFTADQRQARRFVSQLTTVLRSGAHALCTSGTSRNMLADFVSSIGNPSVRFDQFPLPSILFETAKSLDRLSHFQPEEPFILYCSTIEIRKNHLMLAKIWKQARDDGVKLPKLVCAGKWGWGVEDLRSFLDANSYLAKDIEFVGPVPDVDLIDLYRSALFGVVPSRVEGWGYGASECLDFGVPVIVSTAPALQEAARGLMPTIDPDDQTGWYWKIKSLAESATAREALRRRIAGSYQPVTPQESWEAIKAALKASV